MNHFERVRAESRYDTWAGRSFSATSRFHHRIEAPALVGGFRVVGVRRPDPEPAIDFASWEIQTGTPPRSFADVNLFEYATLAATHDEFLQSMQSITRAGVGYAPLPGGPGDVCAAGKMVRDNLVVTVPMDDPRDAPQRIPILRAVDSWLMDDWPLAASKLRRQPAVPLDVVLRAKPDRPRVGEPAALTLEVRHGDTLLHAERLPHRIVVSPGRIERGGAGYVFTPSASGRATVSASVLGPGDEHGAATLTIDVQ